MRTPDEIKKGLDAIAETDSDRRYQKVAAISASYRYFEDVAEDALAYIKQLETERGETAHGTWEVDKDGDVYGYPALDVFFCSCCRNWVNVGTVHIVDTEAEAREYLPKHCPYCDARMDGRRDTNVPTSGGEEE